MVDPQTGRPTGQVRPTILPDKAIDDFTVLKQVVRQYCQENSDIPGQQPRGLAESAGVLYRGGCS